MEYAGTNMTMTWELITPERAVTILRDNIANRTISNATVEAYAQDIEAGLWTERSGDNVISFDITGKLANGQHRLLAIIRTGKSVFMWICRNCDPAAVYDTNRVRSVKDTMRITRPEMSPVFQSNRFIAFAKLLIQKDCSGGKKITAGQISRFVDDHENDLTEFIQGVGFIHVNKLQGAYIQAAMFCAFVSGINILKLKEFRDVLSSGEKEDPRHLPIIAYRDHLLTQPVSGKGGTYRVAQVRRCQYAIKKFLTNSSVKRSIEPDKMIWPWPYEGGE